MKPTYIRKFFDNIKESSYIFAEKSSPLFGTIEVGGAKNMVTKIMTASLLAKGGSVVLENVPLINEVFITLDLFDQLGTKYELRSDKTLFIKPQSFNSSKIKFGERGNRISLLLIAPILARFGEAVAAKPKGCKIGRRKIDFHIEGLKRFGASITDKRDKLLVKAPKGGLKGMSYELPFPSVGATENLMMNAIYAKGKTIIENCAIEPEIIELMKFLQKAGISISIQKDRTMHVVGTPDGFEIPNLEVEIIPDRVEAASWATAALATKGDVFIKGARQEHLISLLGILREMGAGIDIKKDGIRFFYKGDLKPVRITTGVYPSLPTDFQQPLGILLSQINGISSIHETIFEDRFAYLRLLRPLVKNNKDIEIGKECPPKEKCRFAGKGYRHLAKIEGPARFGKGKVKAPDLRATFALLSAACLSDGIKIKDISGLFRGYEHPIRKFKALGANVELTV